MSKSFGFVRLRSALSAGDKTLKVEEVAFLKEIDPAGDFGFTKPKDGIPVVFFVQTGGSEIYFKDCYESYPEPYCLLVQGKRNSLAAALEIKTFLSQQGKRCLLLLGEPKEIHDQLNDYYAHYHAEVALRSMRLGVIGKPSNWLIGSGYNAKEIKKRFGIEIVSIPMKEFLELYDQRILAEPKAMKRFLEKTSRREDLRKSLYVHGALKRLCQKYSLSGFTLRCFDLIKAKQETSCLAFAMLNDEGMLACCEGDVPTMLTMAIAKSLTGKPGFMANPAAFDFDKKEAIYAHCTCPLTMLNSFTIATHFESGLGIGIRGQFDKTVLTLTKLKADLSSLRCLSCSVKENLLRPDLCRTQIRVKFDESPRILVDDPYGNHVLFLQGNEKENLEKYFAYLCR